MQLTDNIKEEILLEVLFSGENERFNNLGRHRGTYLCQFPYFDDDVEDDDMKDDDPLYIDIYTRNGDNDREGYEWIFDLLKEHPNYYFDKDDTSDPTFVSIYFKITVDQLFQAAKAYITRWHPEENFENICFQLVRPYKAKLTEEELKEWVHSFFIEESDVEEPYVEEPDVESTNLENTNNVVEELKELKV